MDERDYIRIDDPEIRSDAYAFIFSQCDSIEYLCDGIADLCGYGYHMEAIEQLHGTELEGLIPALISSGKGKSWKMCGTLYLFNLTDKVKEIVMQSRLDGYLTADGEIVFQNATLYCGKIVLYSCCTHEGYTDYDEQFKHKLAHVCCMAIEKANCYGDMLEVFKNTAKDSPKLHEKEKLILGYTRNYIKQEENAPFYLKPPFECTFAQYKRIAKKFLQAEVYALLEGAKSFSDLHPNGYPQNKEEVNEQEKFAELPQETALLNGIERNLFYLDYIEDKRGREQYKYDFGITIKCNKIIF